MSEQVFLNDGLVERSLAYDLQLQHRGITHAWTTVFWFAVGMGLIYLWFKKRSSDHAKPWALLTLITTLAWIIHIIVDFGFTKYSQSGYERDKIYGFITTLSQSTIDIIDIISFLILLSLVMTYIYSKKGSQSFFEIKKKFRSQSLYGRQ